MRKDAIVEFAKKIGFPDQYTRQGTFDYLRRAGILESNEDWISSDYRISTVKYEKRDEEEAWLARLVAPDLMFEEIPRDAFGFNGYDFVNAIRRWLHENGQVDKSVAEVFMQRADSRVGEASLFVSHVQSQSLEGTLEHMPSEPYVWLDYVVLRQCQPDFVPEHIAKVISDIGNTLVVEDGFQTYLSRAFCVFEVGLTPEGCLEMPITEGRRRVLSEGERAVDSLGASGVAGAVKPYEVNSRNTKARNEEDLKELHRYIEENGGFDEFDVRIRRSLEKALQQHEPLPFGRLGRAADRLSFC